jgi:hypothetical protein
MYPRQITPDDTRQISSHFLAEPGRILMVFHNDAAGRAMIPHRWLNFEFLKAYHEILKRWLFPHLREVRRRGIHIYEGSDLGLGREEGVE